MLARLLETLEQLIAGLDRRARWALVVAWFVVISALSHVQGTDVDSTRGYLELLRLGDLNVVLRMGAHTLVFGVLAVLVCAAYQGDFSWRARSFAAAVAVTGMLGLVDELHQHFVPLRHGRVADAVTDTVGGALVLAAVLLVYRQVHATHGASADQAPP